VWRRGKTGMGIMGAIAFLLDIETILFRTFGGEWQIWCAVAEVASMVWVRTRDVFVTADTAFVHNLHFQMPTLCWEFEGAAASESGVGGRENVK
jgi:hypothetical protein